MREGPRQPSPAHAGFCTRSVGMDADGRWLPHAEQLDLVVRALVLVGARRVLDVGCGVGLVSELIADRTGARVLGLDPDPVAIGRAVARTSATSGRAGERTSAAGERLSFEVADLDALDLVPGSVDAVVAIDSLCCVRDLVDVVDRLRTALVPGGRLIALDTHGWDPRTPSEAFDAASLAPGRTPLGQALLANGLPFTARDLTAGGTAGAASAGAATADDDALCRRFLYQARVP